VLAATWGSARVAQELAPDGYGLHVVSFGTITRVRSRNDLEPPFDEDPAIDPAAQELWLLFREPDRDENLAAQTYVLHGRELRELVARALALRGRIVGRRRAAAGASPGRC
jgi:hypothetical protein